MPDDVAMSVCREFVFVAGCRNRQVKVYSIDNGALVGTIYPGASIGSEYGWVDIPYGIRAATVHPMTARPCARVVGRNIVIHGLGKFHGDVSITDLHGKVVARTRVSGSDEVRIPIGNLSASTFIVSAGSLKAKPMVSVR